MAYEAYKRSYRNTAVDCLAQGMSFIPMVAESSGGWGTSAVCTLKGLAKAEALRTGCDWSIVFANHLSRLSTVIRKHNARAMVRRAAQLAPRPCGPQEARAAAASILASSAEPSGDAGAA